MVNSTLCLIVRIFFNNLIIIVEPLMFAFSINAIHHEAFSFAILSPIQIVRLHAIVLTQVPLAFGWMEFWSRYVFDNHAFWENQKTYPKYWQSHSKFFKYWKMLRTSIVQQLLSVGDTFSRMDCSPNLPTIKFPENYNFWFLESRLGKEKARLGLVRLG